MNFYETGCFQALLKLPEKEFNKNLSVIIYFSFKFTRSISHKLKTLQIILLANFSLSGENYVTSHHYLTIKRHRTGRSM